MAIIDKLSAIGDAIREKTGSTDLLTLDQMPGIIEGIQTGGGDNLVPYASGELTEINSDEIITVKDYFCYQDKTITSINLPNCKTIGNNALRSMLNLSSIHLDNIENITGEYVFSGCKVENVSFPKLKKIDGEYFFRNSDSLVFVDLPNCEEIVGEGAFYQCSNLSDGNFPKLKSISDTSFGDCGFTEINDELFPVLETTAGFSYNSKLKYIKLSNLTTFNGILAFSNCVELETVIFPSITTLPGHTFSKCSKLKNVDLPLLTSIGKNEFASCSSLEKLDLSNNFSSINGTHNFTACSAFSTLILRKSDAIVNLASTNAFNSTLIANGTGYIYVPSALIEEYKVATNWTTFANQFRAIEDYPDVCGEVA